MASSNAPSFLRQYDRDRGRAEVNLSGTGTNWDAHFASKEDLSDAVTFRRGVDNTGFPGTSRHTLSIFGGDGNIRFRDSRSLVVRRRDREGRFRDLEVTVWAAVEMGREHYDVLRHEQNGNDWITLIKLKPGKSFMVTTSPISYSHPGNSQRISHDMLRLWSKQADIRRMPYLAIVAHSHKTYTPWVLVLHKELLGPVVTSAATENPDAEPLIDLSADDGPADKGPADKGPADKGPAAVPTAGSLPAIVPPVVQRPAAESPTDPSTANPPAAESPTADPPSTDLPASDPAAADVPAEGRRSNNVPFEEAKKQTSLDPFGDIWEHAMNLNKSGKGK